MKQLVLDGMPPVDYDRILAADRQLRRRTPRASLPDTGLLFADPGDTESPPNDNYPSRDD
jgi:hypothetical protein